MAMAILRMALPLGAYADRIVNDINGFLLETAIPRETVAVISLPRARVIEPAV